MPRIRKLFKQKKLSYLVMPISRFPEVVHRHALIGTVVIDAVDTELTQAQRLAQVIELLEHHHIGVILLNPTTSSNDEESGSERPIINGKDWPVDLEELWIRISVNLAYRKRSPGMVVKPATPPKKKLVTRVNKLAEQFNITEALVDNLSEQLRLAGLVQRDFLPGQLPNTDQLSWAAAFLPAEWVSGDIYDVTRLDEDHISFFIADAVGHSMPAALLTIFIKQALVTRETCGNEHRIFSPAEVVSNLNVKMAEQKLSGYQFATCCYCLLNEKTLELTIARAGHPYPILIRPGEPNQQIELRGSLLGIFGQTQYTQKTIQLQRGDKIVLYSDGADPFVGEFDDQKGFIFTDQFLELGKLPIDQMIERFNIIAQEREIDPSEVDDITMVGLEIL